MAGRYLGERRRRRLPTRRDHHVIKNKNLLTYRDETTAHCARKCQMQPRLAIMRGRGKASLKSGAELEISSSSEHGCLDWTASRQSTRSEAGAQREWLAGQSLRHSATAQGTLLSAAVGQRKSYFGWPARQAEVGCKVRLPKFGRGPHPSAPQWLAVLLYTKPRMSGNRRGGMAVSAVRSVALLARQSAVKNVVRRLWSLSALVYTIVMSRASHTAEQSSTNLARRGEEGEGEGARLRKPSNMSHAQGPLRAEPSNRPSLHVGLAVGRWAGWPHSKSERWRCRLLKIRKAIPTGTE